MDLSAILAANAPGRPIRTGFTAEDLPTSSRWSTREEQILRTYYQDRGAKACAALLPGRTEAAIRQRFHCLVKQGRAS
ncbi:SANT/Myb-like DNA-binding domain-containing protein [Sphingomonas profundi]|uniref:SANT/Myb-like DNA-binding domain-containing protein n=1 Tax=Alterirhizorhabdus profundi TaxID=2681549 RepID=UPI0012E902C0|nr:SANT/Myb-like DNA-binding domain-containing protein [Sphingomonas profundi]